MKKEEIVSAFSRRADGPPPSDLAGNEDKLIFYKRVERIQETDDPSERLAILMEAGIGYFKADWIGCVDADFENRIMKPYFWCDARRGSMAETPFTERSFSDEMYRWVMAFRQNRTVHVLDVDEIRDIFEGEYQFYRELGVRSIVAIPFRRKTNGFVVIKNPGINVGEDYCTLKTFADMILVEVSEKKSHEIRSGETVPCYRDYLKSERDVFIKLFGKMRIETVRGTVSCEQLRRAKLDLIKLLVCSKYPVSSQDIIEQIEPNSAPRGFDGVRQLIYRTRQLTGNLFPEGVNLIETIPNGYRLNRYLNVITDLSCFRDYTRLAREESDPDAKAGYLQKAIDLYRGDIYVSGDCGDRIGLALTSKYSRIYQNIIEEFCSIHFGQRHYDVVHRVAAEALCRGHNDPDIYYWVVMSLFALKRNVSAEQHLNIACQSLDDDSSAWLRNRVQMGFKKCI